MNAQEIAQTIFMQLGGNGFARMVGLVNPYMFRNDKEKCEITVTFRWKAKSLENLNFVDVTYVEALDTYKMQFGRVHGMKVTRKEMLEDVYCEDLIQIFRSHTGLEVVPPRIYFR